MRLQLTAYKNLWATLPSLYETHSVEEEKSLLEKFNNFYRPTPALFDRRHLPGHFTGSALVTNHTGSHVLLTLHKKLNCWLQLGGHADGEQQLNQVALREAKEESGLDAFTFVNLQKLLASPSKKCCIIPLDLDCHYIPTIGDEPSHRHYDSVFLLIADNFSPLKISDESHELRWFDLQAAMEISSERSLQRKLYKLRFLAVTGVL